MSLAAVPLHHEMTHSLSMGALRPDGESSFAQTREEQIQDFRRLVKEYRRLLEGEEAIAARRREAEYRIATARLRMKRLLELTELMRADRREREEAARENQS
jgi:hypothetical protein